MKLALRYGLIITVGVIAWTIIAHLLVPDPASNIHSLGAMVFFNLLHFMGIYLGIAALGRELGERPTFKQAMKMGVWISLIYAIGASLFFVCVILIIGTRWLAGEPGAQQLPMRLVMVQAFAGLFLFTMLFGLVYTTVISFAMARRLSRQA
jgi:hypothetical protein